jgi:hypothetical protein
MTMTDIKFHSMAEIKTIDAVEAVIVMVTGHGRKNPLSKIL